MRKTVLTLALLQASFAFAADPAPDLAKPQAAPDLAKLQAALGGQQPDSVAPAPISGLYEVVVGGQILYLSGDGRFALQGDVIDLGSRENLTENRRGELRGKAIAALNEKDMVVFTPEGAVKHTVTIFTDIDCGYCRKMHSQIAAYNKEGIKIRYLMFPREGIGSESYNKAVAVWCADDRPAALTQAKRGETVPNKTCENPVQAQFELGQKLGVRGTPSLILESGEMLPGYVPPTQLAELLANNKNKTPKPTAQP